jgi:hypothetical protein
LSLTIKFDFVQNKRQGGKCLLFFAGRRKKKLQLSTLSSISMFFFSTQHLVCMKHFLLHKNSVLQKEKEWPICKVSWAADKANCRQCDTNQQNGECWDILTHTYCRVLNSLWTAHRASQPTYQAKTRERDIYLINSSWDNKESKTISKKKNKTEKIERNLCQFDKHDIVCLQQQQSIDVSKNLHHVWISIFYLSPPLPSCCVYTVRNCDDK